MVQHSPAVNCLLLSAPCTHLMNVRRLVPPLVPHTALETLAHADDGEHRAVGVDVVRELLDGTVGE